MRSEKLFRVKEYIIDSENIVFVFTAMGTKRWMYIPFIKRMNKLGYSCIVYDYNLDFLFNPTFEGWETFFNSIIFDAQLRLKNYIKKGIKNFFSYGASMGTLIANKFARDTKEITHLILNMTYGDVAQNIWTYRGVKKVKEAFIKQKISEEMLREKIKYMDPINTAKDLKEKKVLLQLSKNDRVLVYTQTLKTKQAFEKEVLSFKYEEKRIFGHYITGILNLMSTKKIDNFYKSE